MTVLADTSAWIEFLRGTGSPAGIKVREAIRHGELATTDPVVLEVLAGARTAREEAQLAALLGHALRIPCDRSDYVEAARTYRACRAAGEAVRGMLDCLVAAVAIRAGVALIHADRDFEAIARNTELEID